MQLSPLVTYNDGKDAAGVAARTHGRGNTMLYELFDAEMSDVQLAEGERIWQIQPNGCNHSECWFITDTDDVDMDEVRFSARRYWGRSEAAKIEGVADMTELFAPFGCKTYATLPDFAIQEIEPTFGELLDDVSWETVMAVAGEASDYLPGRGFHWKSEYLPDFGGLDAYNGLLERAFNGELA